MLRSSKTFRLFSCCIPVKGFSQSAIYDIQRQTYEVIPNDLYDILQQSGSATLEQLKEEYGDENADILDEYFAFLEKNDYIFFSDLPEAAFPAIEERFEIPAAISNASIELAREGKAATLETIAQLDACGCQAISVIQDKNDLALLEEVLATIDSTAIESVELSLSYDAELLANLNSFLKNHPKVFNSYMFNAPETKKVASGYKYADLFLVKESREAAGCGVVHPLHFRVNMPFFMEAKHCNSCLNKKIHVGLNGDIKSCPYAKQVLGNISSISLYDVTKSADYAAITRLKKDEVEVCKDCEFRYMCSDCRVFVETPGNSYSKPLKCGYNPYTGVWANEF